jgi:hypothetical protein
LPCHGHPMTFTCSVRIVSFLVCVLLP